MESAKNKMCPMTGKICAENKCAWWCSFAEDCSVPLTAGILADSDINRISWNHKEESKDV